MNFIFLDLPFENTHNAQKNSEKDKKLIKLCHLKFVVRIKIMNHNFPYDFWFTNPNQSYFIQIDLP